MRCNVITNKFNYQKLNFKGINDFYRKEEHSYGSCRKEETRYNDRGQILSTAVYSRPDGLDRGVPYVKYEGYQYYDNGKIRFQDDFYGQADRLYYDKYRTEFKYYDNGNIKSEKMGTFSSFDNKYEYNEFNSDGSLYKKLKRNGSQIFETIYGDGGIAKKEVLKPGYIEHNSYITVELLYKNVANKTPYRILGKDYWGTLLNDIQNAKKLLKTIVQENKVLFK